METLYFHFHSAWLGFISTRRPPASMNGDADWEETEASETEDVTDEETDLADLDPNAEKQARRVERQLRRLQREMRG